METEPITKQNKKVRLAQVLLLHQIKKLEETDYVADDVWITHTRSYIREYFGEESEQYKYFDGFSFVSPYGHVNDPQYELNKERAKKFLRESIDKIRRVGLYKASKKNFFTNMDQSALVGWSALVFAALGTSSFGLGYGIGTHSNDVQNMRLTEENQRKGDTLSYIKEILMEQGIVPYPN